MKKNLLILEPGTPIFPGIDYWHWPLISGTGVKKDQLVELIHGTTGVFETQPIAAPPFYLAIDWRDPSYTPYGYGGVINSNTGSFDGLGYIDAGLHYHGNNWQASPTSIGTSDYSIACWLWMKTNSRTYPFDADWHGIGGAGQTIATTQGWWTDVEDRTSVYMNICDSTGIWEEYRVNYDFDPDKWYHVAICVSRPRGGANGTMLLYVDGTLVGSTTLTFVSGMPYDSSGSGVTFFGTTGDPDARTIFLCGRMYDMWYIKSCLSATQVFSIYKSIAS